MGVHPSDDSYDSRNDALPSPLPDRDEETHPFLAHDADLEEGIKLDDTRRASSSKGTKMTPIPKAQLAVLCVVRLVDPIMFTQIFPYVNEMIDHWGITDDKSKTGVYSGMVVRTRPSGALPLPGTRPAR